MATSALEINLSTADERRQRDASMRVQNIPMELIRDNPYQTRKRYSRCRIKLLARSITERGLMHPISVVKIGENYTIVGGHRRHRALKLLRRKTIPAIVRRQSTPDDLRLDLAVENVLRRDFAPIEKGQVIFQVICTIPSTEHDLLRVFTLINQIRLVEKRKVIGSDFTGKYGFQADDVSRAERLLEMMAISPNTAINYLRLLDLPKSIQSKVVVAYNDTNSDARLRKGRITVNMAYELSRLKDNKVRILLFERVIQERIHYIHLKSIVDEMLETGEKQFKNLGAGSALKKRDANRSVLLSKRCFRLGSSLWNHRRRLVLDQLCLEKTMFRASLKHLRRSCLELTSKTNTLLEETSGRDLELVNQDFSLSMRKGSHGTLLRYNFPTKAARELELEPGDRLLMQITSVEKNGGLVPLNLEGEKS